MTHDRQITISIGSSRKATAWAATGMAWSELAERLSRPIRGSESHAAYLRMPKAKQDELKDIGGFVGGVLRGGRRKAANVTGRDLVTLDLDAIAAGGTQAVLDAVAALGCASCVYSTRKHDAEHPRLRIVIPLDRAVTAEEYEPVARRIGEWLGIANCDPTTFQPYRLMYWPSASADSEFVYDVNDEPFLKAAGVLATYRDWRNMAEWPQVPGQAAEARKAVEKAEDPTAKEGLVGAFCRVYDIRRAMDELIPGAYAPTDDPDRWTYTGGSTAGGAIIYDDKWLYSHHATDPCSGRLVNSWDLVRLHKFGDRDPEDVSGTPPGRLESTKAMQEFALHDDAVKLQMMEDRSARIDEDFGTAPADGDWRLALKTNAKGTVLGSLDNLRLILDNTPCFGCIGLDTFQQRYLVHGPLPWDAREGGASAPAGCGASEGRDGAVTRDWEDADDIGLAWYMEVHHGITDLRRIKMAVDGYMDRHRTDVLRDYLEGLQWDGVKRVETLLVRHLLADDTPYVRAVTRKTLVAAVARAMKPGCKFDNVLTLIGEQGIAKSMLVGALGGAWYNDNIQTFVGKEAAEQLRGVWIVEIPEVDRFSAKYEAAAVKQFITRQDDIYREAYGRRTAPHPRRCIFVASTNEPNFLTDAVNRRWWIVHCRATPSNPGEDVEHARRDRDQIWAEAVEMWREGEPLTLGRELYAEAASLQAGARLEDPWIGMIAEFLEKPVPEDWDTRTPEERLLWWSDDFALGKVPRLRPRKWVCAAEIWCELFRQERSRLDGRTARRITAAIRQLPGWREIGPRLTVYGMQKCYAAEDPWKATIATDITKTTKHT